MQEKGSLVWKKVRRKLLTKFNLWALGFVTRAMDSIDHSSVANFKESVAVHSACSIDA